MARESLKDVLRADWESLKQFRDDDNLFGLSDGVWDLVILPTFLGLWAWSAWRRRQDRTRARIR